MAEVQDGEKNPEEKVANTADDSEVLGSDDKDVPAIETPASPIPEPEPKPTKLISVGSPIPDSYDAKKPPLENWSENNSLADLIYFENLPNSTGVFDKMRSTLRNIRNKLFSKPREPTKPPPSDVVDLTLNTSSDETPAVNDIVDLTEDDVNNN